MNAPFQLGGPKPVYANGVHYPSQRAAAKALQDQGLTPSEIAKATGLSLTAVNNALWACASKRKVLTVPRKTITLLEPHAAKRGVSATVLATKLVGILAREPVLIENLLDEETTE